MTNNVNVSSNNQNTSVNVQSGNDSSSISFVNNAAWHYSDLAKQWAISESLVEGQDYSSKHYAQVASEAAEIVTDNIETIEAVADNIEDISAVAGDLTNINNASNYANLAKNWANYVEGTVDGVEYSAKHYAEIARDRIQSDWEESDTTSPSYIKRKPTIPSDTSDLTNGAGFITGINSGDVTTALGYTPYDSSNPSGYTSNVGTVTSVNNVQPVNGNVTISLPDPLPSQTGQSGKYLTTDGTNASWGTVSAGANTDLSNLTDNGNIAMANASMPSTTYETLTSGASGTVYTAPADGYLQATGVTNSEQNANHPLLWNLMSDDGATQICTLTWVSYWAGNGWISCFVPVKKGGKYRLDYGRLTSVSVMFIYANGAESEAQ